MILISTARIAPAEDGTFSYSPKGSLTLTLAVENIDGDMVDVVAWGRDPRGWWLRRGDETPILGERALAIARWHHEPIVLLENPEQYLKAHRPGGEAGRHYLACMLRWDVDLRPLFDGVSSVQCETPALKRRLDGALHQFDPVIELFSTGARHAA